MKITSLYVPVENLNNVLGIIGIYIFGIFLTWLITAIFPMPFEGDVALQALFTAALQTVCTIFIPYIWAVKRLGLGIHQLGINKTALVKSTILGCLLYSLALYAFIHCSADPLISNHALGQFDMLNASLLLASMCLIAAGTDIATRGFILLGLAKYANIPLAVLFQNLAWFVGHIGEINVLTNCLGQVNAIALTLTLGILGDIVVLKTRNVIGLSIAHIMLNITLTVYIRSL